MVHIGLCINEEKPLTMTDYAGFPSVSLHSHTFVHGQECICMFMLNMSLIMAGVEYALIRKESIMIDSYCNDDGT